MRHPTQRPAGVRCDPHGPRGRRRAAVHRQLRAAPAGDRLLPGRRVLHRRVHHTAGPARPSGRVRRQRDHRVPDRLRRHPGHRARKPSLRRARRPVPDPPHPAGRRHRRERREPALRGHQGDLAAHRRAVRAGALHPLAHHLPRGLPGAQPPARAPQRGDGLVRVGHHRGRPGRAAPGRLDPSAAAAARALPREPAGRPAEERGTGFVHLLSRPEVLRVLVVAFSAFFVFSATFNYLPFYVSRPPISAPLNVVTLLYLAYVVGMVAGPLAGNLSNRLGSGATMAIGSTVLAAAIACTLVPSLAVIAPSLPAICAGFFGVHAAALGTLNRRLTGSRGRANSLYVLFYYLGGAAGISATGWAYSRRGWHGVVALAIAVLLVPLGVGLYELRRPA